MRWLLLLFATPLWGGMAFWTGHEIFDTQSWRDDFAFQLSWSIMVTPLILAMLMLIVVGFAALSPSEKNK